MKDNERQKHSKFAFYFTRRGKKSLSLNGCFAMNEMYCKVLLLLLLFKMLEKKYVTPTTVQCSSHFAKDLKCFCFS